MSDQETTPPCAICGVDQHAGTMTLHSAMPGLTSMPDLDLCLVHWMQMGRAAMDMADDPSKAARGKPSDLHPSWPGTWEELEQLAEKWESTT